MTTAQEVMDIQGSVSNNASSVFIDDDAIRNSILFDLQSDLTTAEQATVSNIMGHNNTFVFEAASAFNDIDTIEDFDAAGDGDILNIADLLVGYNPTTSAISDFLSFANDGSDSQVFVDRDGTAGTYSSAQIALVTGQIDLDADDLLLGGNLVVV